MAEKGRYMDLAEAGQRFTSLELAFERKRRGAGLVLGPALFGLLLLFPLPGLPPAAARLAAVVAWVLVWWVTEAVPIPVTALLGPALAVALGLGKVKEVFAPFGDPVIFLFLGSFILAEAMSIHGLDRRIAYTILGRPWVGASPLRILLAFTLITAGLSMWLSNTATTAMMYPIALGILTALSQLASPADGPAPDPTRLRYSTGLLLTCAYASSIGGIGTPVGTPPNLIALGQLAVLADIHIAFFSWMLLTLPILALMLMFGLIYFRFVFPPDVKRIPGATAFIAAERARLGPLGPGERNVLIAFGAAVILWVLPGVAALVAGPGNRFLAGYGEVLPEGVVALLAAGLLFILPISWRERRFTLTWNQAVRIDWGTLMLFGGGLALGNLIFRTGLADSLGHALTGITGAHSTVALTYLFSIFAIYFTELTSNTATATMLVPLAIAAAQAAGASPLEPAVGCALGASMAFMFPVATPPNAIVYGSGCIRITQMIRAGFWFNIAASLIVPTLVLLLAPLVLR